MGAGAFKETFKVETAGGDLLALKVFQPGKVSERAVREIDAMSRCNHPNIGRLLGVATHVDGGFRYLFLLEEFIPGDTLAALVAANGPLPRDAVVDLGEALIGAVAHIAAARFVHRDLKPENIMLRADRATPVVVDFGLVRNLDETSLTQTWLAQGPGTPLYSAPEQLLNDKGGIDWRTDQFALGLALARVALGLHPYQIPGEPIAAALDRVARRGSQVQPFLDQAIAARLPALVTMTKTWPVHRYRTPSDLLAAWVAQRGTP